MGVSIIPVHTSRCYDNTDKYIVIRTHFFPPLVREGKSAAEKEGCVATGIVGGVRSNVVQGLKLNLPSRVRYKYVVSASGNGRGEGIC